MAYSGILKVIYCIQMSFILNCLWIYKIFKKVVWLFHVWYLILWRRQWHPTPVLLPGEFHGRRGLVGCSPWGREESDMTERLHFHFSLLCTGEGNGNPLQCSCLENPRMGSHRVRHNWSDLAVAVAVSISFYSLNWSWNFQSIPILQGINQRLS